MNIDQHVEAVRAKVKEDYGFDLHDPAVTLARLHYMNNIGVEDSAKEIGRAMEKDRQAGL